MYDRKDILTQLNAQININGHVIGAVVGSGMVAHYVEQGGADLLLALSAGRYRIAGKGSLGSYFCYGSSNDIVYKFASEEVLPIVKRTPTIFGLFAQDPFIDLYDYLKQIKRTGFAGITNFPTIALIDGNFRVALEEEGTSYAKEVEAIRLAHFLDLFTVAFVTNREQTEAMLDAGADVICIHLGLTKGGFMGAKKYISMEEARRLSQELFMLCEEKRPDVIRMVYAGPANTPIDMQYLYQNTTCQGYIGGSVFDRIPMEHAIPNTIRAFKIKEHFDPNDPTVLMARDNLNMRDYVEFIKKYISDNYQKEIELRDLAEIVHVSSSYLSTRFKREMGCSFTEYLIRFRMNKAKELLAETNLSCKEVASSVGYDDYAQFSKMFKKYVGRLPTQMQKNNISTKKTNEIVNK